MSYKPMKITFHLDGTGLYYDPSEPIHLDALLAWGLAPFHCKGEPPGRDEEPFDIPLPLAKWHMNGTWGWKASALFPDGDTADALQFWRKKFRQSQIELTKGSPSLTNGVYREYNTPLPLLLCKSMIAFAVGDAGRVRHILKKHVRYLGKKRVYGKGAVISIDVETIEQDYSMEKDGVKMRWLPLADAPRLVRPRPPYWNNCGKVRCCEVEEKI
ncbi:MAG: hypothetical protein HZB61_10225 [Nitrospirae bacterium]|nr:hypothetical protein [Nitrospirota bacterium]